MPSRIGMGNAITDYITPLPVQNYQGDWDLLTMQNGQLGVVNVDAITGAVFRLPFTNSITGPDTVTYNYAMDDTQVAGIPSHYMFAPTAPGLESHAYTMDQVAPELNSVGTAVFAKQFLYKFKLAEPSRQSISAEHSLRNFQPQKTQFRPQELEFARTTPMKFTNQRWLEYRRGSNKPMQAKPINLNTGFTPGEKAITNLLPALIQSETRANNLWPVTAVYVKAGTADETLITMDYGANTLSTSVVTMEYGTETPSTSVVLLVFGTDTPSTSAVTMDYVRNDVLPITMVVPTWAAADYGFEAFVIYKLQHQQQNDSANSPITLARDIPNHYFTAITVPELNNGILWDHDISVEYGAFATEEDAIYAARNYTEFRPYLIMDTDLWSYRVILDTGLICRLPKGRYPIAWLLRGG